MFKMYIVNGQSLFYFESEYAGNTAVSEKLWAVTLTLDSLQGEIFYVQHYIQNGSGLVISEALVLT
jgi:hypothetical protein